MLKHSIIRVNHGILTNRWIGWQLSTFYSVSGKKLSLVSYWQLAGRRQTGVYGFFSLGACRKFYLVLLRNGELKVG
jgi:hypothetical protein